MSLTFDALGRTVEYGSGSTHTQVLYGPAGGKLALMNGQTLLKARIPLPGGGTATYTSSGLAFYSHADWLGSARFFSTPSQTMYGDVAYAPFGETYAQAGSTDLSFTGQNSDTAGGNFDFLHRQYNNQGRWASPDPSGLAAVSPGNPRSWNRYAYVVNDPLRSVDLSGLNYRCFVDGGCYGVGSGGGGGGSCTIEGIYVTCQEAGSVWQSGAGAPCPDNDCTFVRYTDNGFERLVPVQIPVEQTTTRICDANGVCTEASSSYYYQTVLAYVPVESSGPDPFAANNAAPTFCNPATGICVPRSMIPPPGPSTVQRLGKWAKAYLCGNSPGDAIKEWFVFGAIKGAAVGAITGGVTGTVVGVGVGSAAGVPLGAFTGFTLGATNGLTGGLVAAAVCSAAGVYH